MKLGLSLALCLTLCLPGMASSGKTSGERRGWEKDPRDPWWGDAGSKGPGGPSTSGGKQALDLGRGPSVVTIPSQESLGPDLPDVYVHFLIFFA